jgi:predicted permease
VIIALADAGLFLAAFGLLTLALAPDPAAVASLGPLVVGVLPFVPLAAVGVVLIAGTSFELMSNARFAASDAANWMPLTPGEYVGASATAIAYTYSPAVALVLGGLGPLAFATGLGDAYLASAGLSLVALFEGAFLVEMVRALSNRAGAIGSGRRGAATMVFRAVALVVVILLLDLALNPVILLRFVGGISAVPILASVVPLLWSSRALAALDSGQPSVAGLFAVAQVAFVGLLAAIAAYLRRRYWVPAPAEIRLGEHRYAAKHPILSGVGLDRAEAALVGKDLRGFVRRRELLPLLVVPIVLVILLAIEGSGFGRFGVLLWVGWVAGFFGLLLAVTSVGQERRGLQALFAFPVPPRSIFRAKATAALIPVLIGSAAMAVAVGLWFGFPAPTLAGAVALTLVDGSVLVLWGLVFASRYSDFQERPRPQFVRPGPMIAAMGSGVVLLSAIVVPGALVLADPSPPNLPFAVVSAIVAIAVGAVAYRLARSGFDRLFVELPF